MSNFIINLWVFFLKILFTFLHALYSGRQYFDLAWALFKRKLIILSSPSVIDTELYVSRFITNLDKCPRHLAVIMGNNELRYEDFSNIALWCLAAGISFLTVYDNAGLLTDTESKLHNYFMKNTKVNPGQVTFRNLKQKPGSNGFEKKLFVSILSCADGKTAFVKLVTDYAQQCVEGTLKSSEITLSKISEDLEAACRFPDPDLGIITGGISSTYGFPPWCLRVTEFVTVPTLENVKVSEFCSILNKFSKCEQRLGK